jgi:hypothetical protein
MKLNWLVMLAACAVLVSGCATTKNLATAPAAKDGAIIIKTAAVNNEDPGAAGKEAAALLKKAMGGTEPKVVVMFECYDELALKKKAVAAVASVFSKDIICGGANYGGYTQAGAHDSEAVLLMGIGGDGVAVTAALQADMGAQGLSMDDDLEKLTEVLGVAGKSLASKIPDVSNGKLMLLIADCHSPKNQLLMDGVQSVTGKKLPITGGSINKNDGQTYVYYRGGIYSDSAIAILLKGDFNVAQTGRQAKDNAKVIATAQEGSATAVKDLKGKPFAAIAFDCAGRKGKLDDLSDELSAIHKSVDKSLPLFGSYCAGEYGPADTADLEKGVPYGRGWHIMFTVLGK